MSDCIKLPRVMQSLIHKTFYDYFGTLFLYMKENKYFVNILIKENIYSIYLYLSIETKFHFCSFCPKNGNQALTKYFKQLIITDQSKIVY